MGLARELVESLSNEHKLTLEVSKNNHIAQKFYHSLGFEQVHERKDYYKDGSAALVLQLDQLGNNF